MAFPRINWPHGERTCFCCIRDANEKKGADRPVHQRNLITAFVIDLLESIISKFVSCKISIL